MISFGFGSQPAAAAGAGEAGTGGEMTWGILGASPGRI